MIKAVIFDFDGVLAESVDIKTKAFAKLFKEEGEGVIKRVVNYHKDNTGISRFEKLKYIYKHILKRPLSQEKFRYLCKKFSNIVVGEVVNSVYVKGAKEFLNKYYKQYNLFVVSATPQAEIKSIIKRRNIGKYFKNIYGAPNKKSSIVKGILRSNNLFGKEVVYIGDSLSDYQAALVNNINFIARIDKHRRFFDKTFKCLKVRNLINLNKILGKL